MDTLSDYGVIVEHCLSFVETLVDATIEPVSSLARSIFFNGLIRNGGVDGHA